MTARVSIYARQSLDVRGDEQAVSRQIAECRAYAAERAWEVVSEYVDNDRSATSGAARPAFEALLASKPEAVLVWHVDRLVRLTRDLERVIELGVNVHAVRAGHLDLSNPTGRAVARTVTAWAQHEGEHKAARQRAANDQRAAAGKPFMGRRAFGYAPGGLELVEAEASVYQSAVNRLLRGDSIRAITRMMNDRGAVTTAGNPWATTQVRRLLANPRHAGLRVHRGEVVGPGKWPAIIDEDTHRAVVALLSDPARRPKGRPRAYLLSGVGRCGACGDEVHSRIYGRIERRGAIYVCETRPHLGRQCEPVDEFVSARILWRLAQPDAVDLFAKADQSDRLGTLRDEEHQLTARLDGLAEAFALGEIDRRQLGAGTARLRSRLDAIAAELPSLIVAPAVAELVTADDLIETWLDMTIERQRSIIDTLATVTVHPPGRGARRFREDSVNVEWKATP